MPSTWPVPNFSGSFENFLLIAYDIQAAMSAPAPGSAPTSVPSALPRRICFGYFTASAHMPLNTLPIGWSTISAVGFGVDHVADDLRDREHADHQRDQADAAEQVGVAEGEAREGGRVVEADAGDEQAEKQRRSSP